MARQKETPEKIKIFASPTMTVGILFGWLCGLGIMVFWLSYSPARNASIPLTIFFCLDVGYWRNNYSNFGREYAICNNNHR